MRRHANPFQLIPPDEKRFWRLFLYFLVPCAIGIFIISLVAAVAAATGEEAVFFNNAPQTGLKGVLLSVFYFFVITPLFALLGACDLYFCRTIFPAIWFRIRRLFDRR